MRCPDCSLVNPPDVQRCDCGYNFVLRTSDSAWTMRQSQSRSDLRRAAVLAVTSCLFILAANTVLSGEEFSLLAAILTGLAFIFWPFAMILWTQAKGWHWGWSLLGFSVIGAIVIALLPDRNAPLAMKPIMVAKQGRASHMTETVNSSDKLGTPKAARGIRRHEVRPIAALCILAAFAVALIYPPWSYTYTRPGMAVVSNPAPRSFILSPPDTGFDRTRYGLGLDWKRLSTELLAIGCIGGVVYYALSLWENRKHDA
jgi:hypothetical protein